MIELRTFGRVELKSATGTEIRTVTAQPKRTALLAYLAAAQPRGFQRRDALLALFWPELDQERARAALRKAVHHLRRALGDEALEGHGDEELRLADAVVWSDVAAFHAALEGGEAEAATALYRGSFLDAFFVPDAPEFERWLETERSHLHRLAFEATWEVAERQERNGDAFGAAHWARRAAALAPTDEAAIRRLMTLLDRLGDGAGAVQAYEEFARRIRADLDIEPSAETQAAARTIREAAAAPLGPPTAVTPALPNGSAVPPTAADAAPAPRWWLRAALPVAAALAVGVVALVTRERGQAAANVATDLLAVLPFTVRGDESLAYLGEGLTTLLSTGLGGAGGIRSVDPHAVLTAAARDDDVESNPQDAARLAASFGAGRFVLGDVVRSGTQLRVEATLYDVRRPAREVGSATAQGPVDSLFPLVDRIAAQLITAQRGDSARAVPRLAALTTASIPALKAYLEGEREFQQGAFPRAIAGYQQAIALDSGFAMAHYRLAETYSWSGNDSSRQAAELAVRFGQRLPVAERELLQGFLLYEEGKADEAEALYREILRRRPQELDAVFQLGELTFHHNPVRGRPISESRAFFEQARQWNHSDVPLIHLLELELLERRTAWFDSMIGGIAPESHFWLTGILVHALHDGSRQEWARAEVALRRASDRDLLQAVSHTLYLVEDAAAAERAVRLLVEPSRSPRLRADGHLLLAHLQIAGGRWRAAVASLDSAHALDPAVAAAHAGMLLLGTPLLRLPPDDLERVRAMVADLSSRPTPPLSLLYGDPDSLRPATREYLLALLDLRLGRTDDAVRRAAALERSEPAEPPGLAGALAAGVRAHVALIDGDPARADAELRSMRWRPRALDVITFSPVRGLRLERFLRAEALDRLGRHEEALGWLSSFDEHSPSARVYLAPAHFRQGEILERLRRPADAAASYRRFIGLWSDADPELQDLVTEARRRLAQLSPRH